MLHIIADHLLSEDETLFPFFHAIASRRLADFSARFVSPLSIRAAHTLRFYLYLLYRRDTGPKEDRKRQRRSRDRCEFVIALVNTRPLPHALDIPWTNLVKFSGFTLVATFNGDREIHHG